MISVFHRSIRTVVWVAFALLALLPILALVHVGLLFLNAEHSGMHTAQMLGLVFFAFCCLACGLVVLLHVANHLKDLTFSGHQFSDGVLQDLAATEKGSRPPGIQNELVSLTHLLGRIQNEFTSNLDELQTQAAFLENLRRVLDYTADMVVILDQRNQVLFSNRSAREKLGVLPDASLVHSLAEGVLEHGDALRLTAIFEGWDVCDREFKFSRADDGQPLNVHCLLTVVPLAEGARNKIIVLRDITERTHMERQLYRSEQLAALGQLISGVAHELNNPLAAVLGFAEICRDPQLSRDEIQRNLAVIEREANRTAHIVENLLNFSRQRAAKRSPVAMHDLLERCFSLITYNFRVNNIQIRRHFYPDLPMLEVDEYQIQQVFMNLIINAAQAMRDAHTPKPTLDVTTRLSHDGAWAEIEIADNGPGIARENMHRLFEPFYTTKKDDQGTGLGLTVSRGIIRNHHGDITVSSEFEQGTSFTIRLSLSLTNGLGVRDGLPGDAQGRHATPRLVGRILVIDDEPSILDMTRLALGSYGLEVHTAASLAEAIGLIKEWRFDAILADVRLPDGEGTAILDYLRGTHPELFEKVLFASGDPGVFNRLQKQFGNRLRTINKPFHVNELYELLRRLLPAPAAAATSRQTAGILTV